MGRGREIQLQVGENLNCLIYRFISLICYTVFSMHSIDFSSGKIMTWNKIIYILTTFITRMTLKTNERQTSLFSNRNFTLHSSFARPLVWKGQRTKLPGEQVAGFWKGCWGLFSVLDSLGYLAPDLSVWKSRLITGQSSTRLSNVRHRPLRCTRLQPNYSPSKSESVDLMLGQRLGRWPNIKSALGQRGSC